ncbi:membrane transporter D1-like [Ochlerotatus camptorhynchus]|uniref:membrane transporter D1-like n=1 Tax=Ochlerotatus camptorhynchus TaxID=644619 RepID=UPI0031DCBF4C
MGSCGAWFEMTQKNKPQSNALSAGLMTLLTSGMITGSIIFNMDLQHQPWTFDHSDSVVLVASIIFYVAAVIGTLAGYFLVDRYEKKPLSKVYLVLTTLACILLIIYPDILVVVAFSRSLLGLAHGMAYMIVVIHGGEIVIKDIRGMNISAVSYCIMIGALSHGAISPGATYEVMDPNRLVGILGLIYSAMGGLMAQFLTYESPVFLLQQGCDADAIKSMMKLRNESTETWDIRNDLTEFKTMLDEDRETSRSILKDGNVRPLVLLSLCKIASVLSFNMALNLVRLHLLDQLFGLEEYSMSAVVILMVRILLGMTAFFSIDKFGRKATMIASTFGSGIILTILGMIYLIAYSVNRDVGIAFVLAYEVFASAGVAFVPDVYCSEAFSTKKKAASIGVVQTVENALQIMITAIVFTWDFKSLDSYGGVMMTCGVPMLVLAGVFYRFLPETTKMTIRQSRTEFAKRGEIVFGGTKRPMTQLNE